MCADESSCWQTGSSLISTAWLEFVDRHMCMCCIRGPPACQQRAHDEAKSPVRPVRGRD